MTGAAEEGLGVGTTGLKYSMTNAVMVPAIIPRMAASVIFNTLRGAIGTSGAMGGTAIFTIPV